MLRIFKETLTRTPRKPLLQLFEFIAEDEAEPEWQGRINVVFSTDQRLRALNMQFRSLDKPTDVLSFNLDEPDDPSATFGEVYISVPTAKRQAADYGATLSQECLRLACHGLLHLYGYDHKKKADEEIMMSRQENYLSRLSGEKR